MASKAQTWIAFNAIVKRSLTTITPTRSCPSPRPHHQTLVSQATSSSSGRKLPRNHFTSHRLLLQNNTEPAPPVKEKENADASPKRKAARTQGPPTSLRRVAVEAQRSSKVIKGSGRRAHVDPEIETKDVTAYCAAETYNIHVARHLLEQEGFEPDPFHTGLFPQVLHVQTPQSVPQDEGSVEGKGKGVGDVFVFPSGSVVAWNVPERLTHDIVERILPKAAEKGHLEKLELEDLEYVEDASRETSKIVGDTIVLGTKASSSYTPSPHDEPPAPESKNNNNNDNTTRPQHPHEIDTILAKIAFSSALARSTKLAVLENSLNSYFATTRSIPTTLSAGSRLRYSRAFILQKTGELLSIRAQLNLYSELTDSLPDLFWDSPHELGLESYYEQVGRALDVGVRIKVLNEKMDHASEIAGVLRERLSERHSAELEWLIIGLISVEVGFEIARLWRERGERGGKEEMEGLWREYLKKELGRT